MNVLEIVSGVLLIISCVAIVLAVMFQESKSGMSGAMTGSADSFFSGSKSMTNQAILSKITKYAAIALVVLTLVVNAINIWMK